MLPSRKRRYILALGLLIAAAAGMLVLALSARPARSSPPSEPWPLPVMRAIPMRLDTLFLGGYARGSFAQALQHIASDLSRAERTMIGRHLDKMFAGILRGEDLTRGGRLRLAYERSVRSDGSTRSIRVLTAETAVGGQLHTVFFHEHDGHPGYFDDNGHALDPDTRVRPLRETRVSSPFGKRRRHPILNRVLPHLGVDYAAPRGAPVRATGDGSVSAAAARGGYGNLVEIQHPNGYATRYAHLSRIAPGIQENAPVRQGDVIGYVGMTGLATGPHLHYEVRRHGRPVDPESVAAGGPPTDIGYDTDWRLGHRQLASLLARAPRVTAAASGGG